MRRDGDASDCCRGELELVHGSLPLRWPSVKKGLLGHAGTVAQTRRLHFATRGARLVQRYGSVYAGWCQLRSLAGAPVAAQRLSTAGWPQSGHHAGRLRSRARFEKRVICPPSFLIFSFFFFVLSATRVHASPQRVGFVPARRPPLSGGAGEHVRQCCRSLRRRPRFSLYANPPLLAISPCRWLVGQAGTVCGENGLTGSNEIARDCFVPFLCMSGQPKTGCNAGTECALVAAEFSF